MIICFSCPPETKRQLDDLLASGSYSDYSAAFVAAVANLVVLESTIGSRGAIVLSDAADEEGAVSPTTTEVRAAALRLMPPRSVGAARGEEREPVVPVAVPHIFSVASISSDRPQRLAPILEADADARRREVSLDRWVFGQFSKLLPAKASCRALANLAGDHAGGFELDKVSARIAADVAVLSDYLSAVDHREGFSRDDALSLGFPSNGEHADRSRLRYATQFVGTMTKDGQLWGALADFKFIGPLDGRRVHLTEAGWHFAMLPNPVLDAGAAQRFSAEEVEFFIEHVRRRVPAEHFAYRTVLRAIRGSADTPQKLDRICGKYVSAKAEFSDAFITTQRTGVVSRLKELGLIGRNRDGVKVTYFVTDAGDRYLDRAAA